METVEIKNRKDYQAIKIPNNLFIDDDKVYIKKVGNALFLIPFHHSWSNLSESVALFTPDFMENRTQPIQQNRDSLDL